MFDYEAEWSRSQDDRPHRLAVSYIWEVPGPRTGLLGQIIGGWQLSGVTSGQSGQPFTIWTGVDSSGDANTGSDRPDVNTSGSFVWDDDHKTFTNNGYYTVRSVRTPCRWPTASATATRRRTPSAARRSGTRTSR
ncbi:MAG: hypothetical protein ACRD15_02660 [Vicinamibacterales bacterium]